jgi:hypothetical protein
MKDWPSWVLDADAWEQFLVDIEDHPAGSIGHSSPEESDDNDIPSYSEDSIYVDDGSDEEEGKKLLLNKKYTTQRKMKKVGIGIDSLMLPLMCLKIMYW